YINSVDFVNKKEVITKSIKLVITSFYKLDRNILLFNRKMKVKLIYMSYAVLLINIRVSFSLYRLS
ncbi:hypothetical protein, partial [Listeria monocytogenes]|uniref:hypothetical protein n=1 Tax=Listeria monocytogenes TaxID=1639 RepID=UPI001CA4CC31